MARKLTWEGVQTPRPKEIVDMLPDTLSDQPVVNETADLVFWTNEIGRDSTIVCLFRGWEVYDGDLAKLASWIMQDCETVGLVDLDPVEWSIKIGNSFHGLPEYLTVPAAALGVDVKTYREPDAPWNDYFDFTWLVIQCTDWAS